MKLELERQDFLKAWQIAEKFSVSGSAKTTQNSINGIFVKASENNEITLEATDLKTSIRCQAKGANVLEPGFAVIPAAIFGSMLKKSASEDLVLDVNSSRGFLNSGSNKTRFAVVSADEFPRIPESSSAEEIFTIKGEDLMRLINESSSAASQPADFPKYMGACLLKIDQGSVKGVSTDGKRLSLSNVVCENVSKEEDLLLPAPALKELAKMIASNYSDKDIKISADDSTAWFNFEDIELSIRRIDAAFPQYERILNSETCTTLKIAASDLTPVLERIDIIARTTPAHIMAIELKPEGQIKITARAPEMGTTSEILEANVEGNYLQVGYNVGYFIDGLKALGGGEAKIEFSGEEGQTRMYRNESNDFLYMLMPARLSSQDKISEDEEIEEAYQPVEAPQNPEEPQQNEQNESY